MAYIGSAPSPSQVQFSTLDAQSFNGDGSTTAFTLNRAVSIAASIEVTVNNVQQSPYDGSYTVNGTTTLTFSEAPSSGTDNIYVRFLDYPLASITPGAGTVGLDQLSATGTPSSSTFLRGDNSWQAVSVTPTAVSSQANSATDYFALPAGTTAQRPGTPAAGMIRMNTTTGYPEWYDSSSESWVNFYASIPYSVEFLVVAGGGSGGGYYYSGGGGAGGYLTGSLFVDPSSAYTVVVGAGGAAQPTALLVGNSGSNSSFTSYIAIGGGGGAGNNTSAATGGSGGGGGPSYLTGAAGTSGQGNAGGNSGGATNNYGAGGGGGAGAVGGNGGNGTSGNGGAGLNWQSLGNYYAGGGGGANGAFDNAATGLGGIGGGGRGARYTNGAVAVAGTANTGGGGGGGCHIGTNTHVGEAGGSGIVIIRYAGSQRGSGGTVTSSGGYTYHTFTSSGTYTA